MKRKSMLVAFRRRACDSWHVTIVSTDIKFICNDLTTHEAVFAVKSPLTNQWMSFRVTHKLLRAAEAPEYLQPILSYYTQMRMLLDNARAFQPLNHDLHPLTKEEKHLFCVAERS